MYLKQTFTLVIVFFLLFTVLFTKTNEAQPTGKHSKEAFGGTTVDCSNFDINSFTESSNSPFATGEDPFTPKFGDFNNDGVLDIVIGNSRLGTVSYFQGNGNGNFNAAVNISAGVTNAVGIAVADFNGDGNQDFAVAGINSNNVAIMLGNGAGAFSAAANSPIRDPDAANPIELVSGDFDGDGDADLATTNLFHGLVGSSLTIFDGDGSGGFTVGDTPRVGNTPLRIVKGDFNNDSSIDLATVGGTANPISIMIGDGTGDFTRDSLQPAFGNPLSLQVADFNNDGNQDIITGSRDTNDLSLLLGDGMNGFPTRQSIDIGFLTQGIIAADFNGDGNADFLAAQFTNPGAIKLQLGNGNGTFSDGGQLTGFASPGYFAVADFNGDNALDFVFSEAEGDQIRVFLNQCGASVIPNAAPYDFDGDGKSDISVFRPDASNDNNNFWTVQQSANSSVSSFEWGIASDAETLAPADYDGDGKTDYAVWRESEQNFYIYNSSDNSVRVENFGLSGDDLMVGDWDGDDKADLAVYREGSQSFFYYRGSNNNPNEDITFIPWGTNGDKPMLGDFDGDNEQDAAVFRPANNTWYIHQSSNDSVRYENWGLSTDTFVSADYDGDSKTDLTVFRDGIWYILQSSNNQARYETFGLATDKLVPADYDGDGKIDVAVFRDGIWYIKQSSNSNFKFVNFGLGTDTPVPSAYIIQ